MTNVFVPIIIASVRFTFPAIVASIDIMVSESDALNLYLVKTRFSFQRGFQGIVDNVFFKRLKVYFLFLKNFISYSLSVSLLLSFKMQNLVYICTYIRVYEGFRLFHLRIFHQQTLHRQDFSPPVFFTNLSFHRTIIHRYTFSPNR